MRLAICWEALDNYNNDNYNCHLLDYEVEKLKQAVESLMATNEEKVSVCVPNSVAFTRWRCEIINNFSRFSTLELNFVADHEVSFACYISKLHILYIIYYFY